MKYTVSIIFVLFSFTIASASSNPKSIEQALIQSYQQGSISKTELLVKQLDAIYNPDNLPEEYKIYSNEITRNATHLKFQAFQEYQTASLEEKEILKPYLSRASYGNLTDSFISPSGLFKLHYTTVGEDAATLEFIQAAALAFDHSFDIEVNEMGYMPPPIDDPDDPQYDVYIYNFGDYGATTPEYAVSGTKRDDYTSYIEMDNDFLHTPTQGVGAINVTAAHEFFHMIHLGYRGYFNTEIDAIFLFESTATWMEDVVYDDVNDYYYYVPSLFQNLDQPFYSTGYSHEYGLGIFHHMLEKKYDRNIVKSIWEYFIDHEVFEAINLALLDYGSSFKMEIADFSVWNYFTGNRADSTTYYPEGEFYPQIDFAEEKQIVSELKLEDKVEQQSTNYYKVSVKSSGEYSIVPDFDEPENWIYSIIINNYDDNYETIVVGGDSPKNLDTISSLSEIIVCPIYSRFPDVSFVNNKAKTFSMKIERGSVSESVNEIVEIKPNPFMPDKHEYADIIFNLEEQSDDVYVSIYNESGQKILRSKLEKCPDGTNIFQWRGINSDGEGVVSGVYLVIIESSTVIGPAKIALVR